jgi:hypothetical protein
MPLDESEMSAGAEHPATASLKLAETMQIPPEILRVEPEFHERIQTAAGIVDIYLACFTTTDPPRSLFRETGGRFCSITELRGGPPADMALLRKAYEHILGG